MATKCKIHTLVALALLVKAGFITALFVPLQIKYQAQLVRNNDSQLYLSSPETTKDTERNYVFIKGLMGNLSKLCDRYIMNGSPIIREQVFNILDQIATEASEKELVNQSIRMVKRAGVPIHQSYLEKYQKESDKNEAASRRQDVKTRKEREYKNQGTKKIAEGVSRTINSSSQSGKSALSRRIAGTNGKPDLMTPSILDPDSIATIAKDKNELQKKLENGDDVSSHSALSLSEATTAAESRVSELIARAGSGVAFEGQTLGVGGLDDVLEQIKRRIWTPLAAPPQLLKELGIHPARGLLLYGKPGCGKSLLASTLGSMLSPFRPVTVVSGPEILDKFVGSSEKNLRDIFDNPPDIYDKFRQNEADGGESIGSAALHVIVMDEFDAVARSRGGSGGKGGQGDAGVARDSVVNQLLAKMDGVQPLAVPTLVIGLTNKRSLIEPALLRPGRFEVQIEIPPPRTTEQRISILMVHTKHMFANGRLQVNDPPPGTTAAHNLKNTKSPLLLSYEELMKMLALSCDGFSGAAIAGVTRAAASRALERVVSRIPEDLQHSSDINSVDVPNIMDCLVTKDDFYEAINDVRGSMGTHDHTEDQSESNTFDDKL
eukprot:CAMPEP_0170955224 /NCGR_PEP_ID=MMETSP0735-20130129/33041_1 /TAXON_ID=186038 /ORGANISM="Fragilariopsis kerguelensis, Strain L26-C5" /LENGTH=603 /DNA_ID=CAMNT_0011367033 /DNA_START=38 /DNA_END=1846 /DNA_ORIENTATION=+